jgi:hypothetical protein
MLRLVLQHVVAYQKPLPILTGIDWNQLWNVQWQNSLPLSIDQCRSESHSVRPVAQLKLAHDGDNIALLFKASERSVCVRETVAQGAVWRDSCVEFFLQPPQASGYFNFEFNAAGCIHASWVTDWQRDIDGNIAERTLLGETDLAQIQIANSFSSATINTSVDDPVDWYLSAVIPLALLRNYTTIESLSHGVWRGNAYKCAERSVYPHWLSWSPLSQLNFHAPNEFGEIVFSAAV